MGNMFDSKGNRILRSISKERNLTFSKSEHRFAYEGFGEQKLEMLYPSTGHVVADKLKVGFTKQKLANPFPVKEEHATVCQYQKRSSTLS